MCLRIGISQNMASSTGTMNENDEEACESTCETSSRREKDGPNCLALWDTMAKRLDLLPFAVGCLCFVNTCGMKWSAHLAMTSSNSPTYCPTVNGRKWKKSCSSWSVVNIPWSIESIGVQHFSTIPRCRISSRSSISSSEPILNIQKSQKLDLNSSRPAHDSWTPQPTRNPAPCPSMARRNPTGLDHLPPAGKLGLHLWAGLWGIRDKRKNIENIWKIESSLDHLTSCEHPKYKTLLVHEEYSLLKSQSG